jgi:TonB family protein
LNERIEYAGIWFPDAACRKEFLLPRVIPDAERAALAQCLAGLHVAADDRRETMPDFALFTYGPGLEIELRIHTTDLGTNITWIGYVGSAARSADAILPTVAQATFEAQRTGGDPDPATVHAWFKICVDHAGAVTGVHPIAIDTDASLDDLSKTIGAWTFRPFQLGGAATPACSWIEIGGSSAEAKTSKNVVPIAPIDDGAVGPQREMIAGSRLIVPDDDTKQQLRNASDYVRLTLTLRYCIDPDGKVTKASLYTSSGVARYDRAALAAIFGWRFERAERETCTATPIIYVQTTDNGVVVER